jgi:hypothetical protein
MIDHFEQLRYFDVLIRRYNSARESNARDLKVWIEWYRLHSIRKHSTSQPKPIHRIANERREKA